MANTSNIPLVFLWDWDKEKEDFISRHFNELLSLRDEALDQFLNVGKTTRLGVDIIELTRSIKNRNTYGIYYPMAHREKCVRIVGTAKKKGLLTPQPCEVCGTQRNVHAHHEDYGYPLVVNWLCSSHHQKRHREINKMIEEKSYTQEYVASMIDSCNYKIVTVSQSL